MKLIHNEQKMLDIVFANRNKSYGAYAVRSEYGSTLFKSLIIVFFTVLSTLGLAVWLKESAVAKPELVQIIPDCKIIEVDIHDPNTKKLEEPKSEPAASKGGSKNISSLGTLIKNNAPDSVQQTVNTNLLPINTSTSTGDDLSANNPSATPGGGNSTTTALPDNNPKDYGGVDENPEFEGGHAALLAFVRKNLVYPNIAAGNGKQGTLYVKFVVDESGKVSDILLQNNLGYGLDDEAMRVVRMIPKFKSPGKIKGQPVKTYYQIPIKFKLG